MEDDEDDLYGGSGTTNGQVAQHGVSEQPMYQAEGEEGEAMEDEDDSDDSDIDIVVERKPETTNQAPRTDTTSLKPPDANKRQPSHSRDHSGSSTSPRPTSIQPAQPQSRISKPTSNKPGSSYPAVHTSNPSLASSMDPTTAAPAYTLPSGESKTLTDLDFDADLAEHTKPWRLPGTDQSDYFNYGFDEFTWATYCLRQKDMRAGIDTQKEENKKFEMMFGGGAGGPMPGMPQQPQNQGPPMGPGGMQQGMPQGMGPMGGMPDMNDPMMQQMMQQMMASGMDPSQMDLGAFMQQMQGGGMGGQGMPMQQMGGNPNAPPGAPAGPSAGQGQQQGGYEGGQQGYGGRGGGRQNRRRQGGWQ